jgi:hypothetical protein
MSIEPARFMPTTQFSVYFFLQAAVTACQPVGRLAQRPGLFSIRVLMAVFGTLLATPLFNGVTREREAQAAARAPG